MSLRGYRGSARIATGSGAIDIAGYCGNSLDARAGAGDIAVDAACAPPRLSLRSGVGLDPRGAAARPLRPRRREHVRAARACAGSTPRADAPYSVQVLSGSGDVSVEGRS